MSDQHSSSRGYRPLTKLLHWMTVAALATQFAVGYAMDVGGRGRGRGGGSGRGRGRGGDDELFDDDRMLTVHVVLGLTILALAIARLLWRRRAGLPPWAPQLGRVGRSALHASERVLYTLLFVIPGTGLWLVFVSDDAVGLHVAAHIAFFVAVAVHAGLVLARGLLPRML